MKQVKLNFKGSYEEAVSYIYKNEDVTEPTEFIFTRVVTYNHKQRKYNGGKWSGEREYSIKLYDNDHKANLNRKVNCNYSYNPYTTQEYFEQMGID